jgi:DNA-binding XRE family transcriptional regulator
MLDSKTNFYGTISEGMKLDPEAAHRSRLQLLRAKHDNMSQAEMARRLDMSIQRYNNIERGMPLSHDAAMRIVDTFPGVDLDWLYRGVRDGLSAQMLDRLYPPVRRGKRTTDAL